MESYTGKGRGRVEGMDKATGRAVYAADYYEELLPDLQYILYRNKKLLKENNNE